MIIFILINDDDCQHECQNANQHQDEEWRSNLRNAADQLRVGGKQVKGRRQWLEMQFWWSMTIDQWPMTIGHGHGHGHGGDVDGAFDNATDDITFR